MTFLAKPKPIKDLPGLSPGALCRNRACARITRIQLALNSFVTQSKIVADGTVDSILTIAPFPSTTLIRLYELLKNSRRPCGLIYWQMPISKHPFPDALILKSWWRMTGSNRRPPACKAGALPAELIPLRSLLEEMVGLVGLEPTTPALSRRCSNQLSYRPKSVVCELMLP